MRSARSSTFALLAWLLGSGLASSTAHAKADPAWLAAVQSDRIQFATYRPQGSRFSTLERRVKITAPPELVALAASGDATVLDELLPLLREPRRAWAAEVLLAALTGHDEKAVDSYARTPTAWWQSLGPRAHRYWSQILDDNRGRWTWDEKAGRFVASPDDPRCRRLARVKRVELAVGTPQRLRADITLLYQGSSQDHYDDGGWDHTLALEYGAPTGPRQKWLISALAPTGFHFLGGVCARYVGMEKGRLLFEYGEGDAGDAGDAGAARTASPAPDRAAADQNK